MKKKKNFIIIWVVEYKIAKVARSSQSEDTNETNLSLYLSKNSKGKEE